MGESEKVIVQKKGIGWFGALMLILITLKLTGHIKWHWVWVFAPVWGIPAAVIGAAAAILALLALIFALVIVIGVIKVICQAVVLLLKALCQYINRGLAAAKARRAKLKRKEQDEATNLEG